MPLLLKELGTTCTPSVLVLLATTGSPLLIKLLGVTCTVWTLLLRLGIIGVKLCVTPPVTGASFLKIDARLEGGMEWVKRLSLVPL